MTFDDRYSSAIRAANLRSEATTDESNVDIIGAAGFASRAHPLALALLRLFSGDNHASAEIIDILTGKIVGKAYRLEVDIDAAEANAMALVVLHWFREPRCRTCRGHGRDMIAGTPTLGKNICKACRGAGVRDIDTLFPLEHVELARWLVAEMQRETAKAAPEAMAFLAPRLDL